MFVFLTVCFFIPLTSLYAQDVSSWFVNPPHSEGRIYGAGSASLKRDNDSKKSADMKARAEIAESVSSIIKSAVIRNDNGSSQRIIAEVVNSPLFKTVIEQREKIEQNYYSLAYMEKKRYFEVSRAFSDERKRLFAVKNR